MFKVTSFVSKQQNVRYSFKAAEKLLPTDKFMVESSVNGMTVVTIQPKVHTISRVAAVFHAGSRFETYESNGLNHLLRRSVGLSSGNLSAVNVTRHIQQMGASIRCIGTRETLTYVMDYPSDLQGKAIELLSHVATRQNFYNWELKENANKLMDIDIQLLNRRDFKTLCIEMLHKAAYRDGLGNSLFADQSRLGDYTLETIENFLNRTHAASKSMLIGVSINNTELLKLAELFNIRPLKDSTVPQSRFRGGDTRKELPLDCANVALVWEGPGFNNLKESLCTSILSYAIDSGINQQIKWNTGDLDFIRKIVKKEDVAANSTANSIFYSYSDSSLFGFILTGDKNVMNDALTSVFKHFIAVGQNGISTNEFNLAKKLFVSELKRSLSSNEAVVEGIISQALSTNDILSVEQLIDQVQSITIDDVNKVCKQILSSSKMAMAAVGDLSRVPYLNDLN